VARKILILTQYYPPETGAPQNRLLSLAKSLQKIGWEVSVLTAMPNYPKNKIYEGYEGKKKVEEIIDNIKVVRTRIYVSASRSIISRLLNYFSFVWSSWTEARKMTPVDIIFCESPPLFLGISAVLLKRKFKSKLVFNVSDLWPESAVELNVISNRFFLDMAYKLEAWIYRSADLVTGQTQGIVNDIENRFPEVETHWLPNGFDFNDIELMPNNINNLASITTSPKVKTIVYAGIIGHAQGLEVILNAADCLREHPEIQFLIIGDGPEHNGMVEQKNRRKLQNVTFTGLLPRGEVLNHLHSCSATVIPLKKLDLFKGAIPSKIFESLAFKKPILLGVDGEARTLFIDDVETGVYFEPENHIALADAILSLFSDEDKAIRLGNDGYQYVLDKFNRKKIADKFNKILINKLE
jgi:glycosyltransferase involved in cell wall biosynthesis